MIKQHSYEFLLEIARDYAKEFDGVLGDCDEAGLRQAFKEIINQQKTMFYETMDKADSQLSFFQQYEWREYPKDFDEIGDLVKLVKQTLINGLENNIFIEDDARLTVAFMMAANHCLNGFVAKTTELRNLLVCNSHLKANGRGIRKYFLAHKFKKLANNILRCLDVSGRL